MLTEMVALVIIGAVVKQWGHYVSERKRPSSLALLSSFNAPQTALGDPPTSRLLSTFQVPYILAGDLICIVGTALLTQLHPHTRTVQWAAYLVVTGLGLGLAMQLPYTAIQVTLS